MVAAASVRRQRRVPRSTAMQEQQGGSGEDADRQRDQPQGPGTDKRVSVIGRDESAAPGAVAEPASRTRAAR